MKTLCATKETTFLLELPPGWSHLFTLQACHGSCLLSLTVPRSLLAPLKLTTHLISEQLTKPASSVHRLIGAKDLKLSQLVERQHLIEEKLDLST
jgi:hypothetical protein